MSDVGPPLERRANGCWYYPDGTMIRLSLGCAVCRARFVEFFPETCASGRKGVHPTTAHPHYRCPRCPGPGVCFIPPARASLPPSA